MTSTWRAPTATGPLRATVAVPGSKSMTNRALVLAALADGPTWVRGPLRARDTELMAAALRALGCAIVSTADQAAGDATGDWLVTPARLAGPASIDCGLAGTVMRFVPALAALASGAVAFDGDAHARLRPMSPVIDALRALGVDIDDGGRGALPFVLRGTGSVRGGRVDIDASGSSQFVSALLLAGCRYDDGVSVHSVGPTVPSVPHIDMSLAMLAAAGVEAGRVDSVTWQVQPGVPHGGETVVEPDVSNAMPFAAAALATGGQVTITGFPSQSPYQAVAQALGVLAAMGARVSQSDGGLLVDGSGGLVGADLDLSEVGELTPVVAALACLADSPSQIRGVAHLRGHETDRLAALTKELSRLGADVQETPDGLAIAPARLSAGVFETYDDHRLATAAAVLGLRVPGVEVVNVETTAKTLPGFVDLWTELVTP
jgi:3-phosphoshikimate 1-carboxyvinyltransferase